MSLDNFLAALLEDKEMFSFDVEIVQDNALNESKSKLSLQPEEPKCKWSRLKRQGSDSFLVRPGRRSSLLQGTQTMNDRTQSDTSLMQMPRRMASPKQTMRTSVPSDSDAKNASWDSIDLNKASKKKMDSKSLLNLLLSTPEKKSSNGRPSDPMMFGLLGVPRQPRSHQSHTKQSSSHQSHSANSRW
jgi:hypothetical protein